MLRLIGVSLLAFGAWIMVKNNAAEAAPAFPIAPEPEPDQPPTSGPPPEFVTRMPVAPGGIGDLVAAINANEFDGWFSIPDVLAVIQVESSFNPGAYRAEPAINDASYGLMQVLYSTARDRGYTGDPEGLFDPETGIRFGMRQLKWSWDYLNRKAGAPPSLEQWIGSYNAGVGNVRKGFIPWTYVNRWKAARARWAGV